MDILNIKGYQLRLYNIIRYTSSSSFKNDKHAQDNFWRVLTKDRNFPDSSFFTSSMRLYFLSWSLALKKIILYKIYNMITPCLQSPDRMEWALLLFRID